MVLEKTFKHTAITPQVIPQEFPGDKLRHRKEKAEEEAEKTVLVPDASQHLLALLLALLKVISLICIIILSNFS